MTVSDPVIDLNPQNATLLLDHVPVPFAGAYDTEQQAGTELASFRIPHKWKPLVQRIVTDPRFGYSMQPGRFYQHAVGEMIMLYARLLKDDGYYSSVIKELRDLQEFIYVQDVQARFAELLERIDKQGKHLVRSGNLNRAYNYARRVMRFVVSESSKDEILGDELKHMARESATLQDLVRMVVSAETFDGQQADALQSFYAEA